MHWQTLQEGVHHSKTSQNVFCNIWEENDSEGQLAS